MNTVLSSYGQLSGCPEILKKSCKFFCRGLDIRVPDIMHPDWLQVYPAAIVSPSYIRDQLNSWCSGSGL